MQPDEIIPNTDYEALESRCLAELLDLSADYALMRSSLLNALGVSEEDLRQWEEASSTLAPRIETVTFPDDDDDGDFEVTPRGGETEFILDDPDEEDEEDEDAEKPESDEGSDDEEDSDDGEENDGDEDDEGAADSEIDDDGEFGDDDDFDPDDTILDDDDGEAD